MKVVWIMTKQLTERQKAYSINPLIARDGHKCFYCKGPFGKTGYVFEHLNDNPGDNRFDNLVLSHQSCNVRKASSADFQIMAKEKLKENESKNFLVEWERERKHSTHKETSDEADLNKTIIKLAKQFLIQELLPQLGHTPRRKEIPMKEAIECICYLVQEETGRGSHTAVQRHLETLTCVISKDFARKEVNGKKYIVRREGL